MLYVGTFVEVDTADPEKPLSCDDALCSHWGLPARPGDLYCGGCGDPYELLSTGERDVANKLFRDMRDERLVSSISLGVESPAPHVLLWLPDKNARERKGWHDEEEEAAGTVVMSSVVADDYVGKSQLEFERSHVEELGRLRQTYRRVTLKTGVVVC